jgi:hypothetical protein
VRKHNEALFELKLPSAKCEVKWLKDGKPIILGTKFKVEVTI